MVSGSPDTARVDTAYGHIITPNAAALGATLNGATMDDLRSLMRRMPENSVAEGNFRAQIELRNAVNTAKERIVGPVRANLDRLRASSVDAAMADLRARTEETVKHAAEIDAELLRYGPVTPPAPEAIAVARATTVLNRFSTVPVLGMFIAPLTASAAANPTGAFRAFRTRAESAFYGVLGVMAPNNQIKEWAALNANRLQAINVIEGIIGTRRRAFDQRSVNAQQVAAFINGKPNWQNDLRGLVERALAVPAAPNAPLTWATIIDVGAAEAKVAAERERKFAETVKARFGDKVADFKLETAPGKASAARKPGNKFDITLSRAFVEDSGALKAEGQRLLELLGVVTAPVNTVNVTPAGEAMSFERNGPGVILNAPISGSVFPQTAPLLNDVARRLMTSASVKKMQYSAALAGAKPTVQVVPGAQRTLLWNDALEAAPALLTVLPPAIDTERANAAGLLPAWEHEPAGWTPTFLARLS